MEKQQVFKVSGPRIFFLECADLFRALGRQKQAGELTHETLDAMARVHSWLRAGQETDEIFAHAYLGDTSDGGAA